MFNGNLAGNGNEMGYRVQRNAQGQYQTRDDHDHEQTQAYGGRQQYKGWGGNENKIGRWIRGVTPGKPPPQDGVSVGYGLGNVDVRDRKNYKLSQPLWGRRRRQYDGPINDELLVRERGGDRNTGGRQGGRQGQGAMGMMNWFSTLPKDNTRKLQNRNRDRIGLGNDNNG